MRIKDALLDSEVGVLKDLSEIAAVGHRIVQGGSIFNHSVLVDEKVIDDIEGLADLAPLHNHAHVQGIRACREVFGTEVPEVVVFDTAFHSTMPPKLICSRFLMSIMKNIKSAAMAFTALLTVMSARSARR